MSSPEKLLVLIAFLNSLCIGLTVPVITPHIMKNGGDNLIVGLLVSMTFISQNLSKIIMSIIEGCFGKKQTLSISLNISLISYAIMILSPAYWLIFLGRFLFAFSNRAEVLCKQLVPTESPMHNIIDTICIAGIVLGNFLAGHVFSVKELFACNSLVALLVVLINLFLYKTININDDVDKDKPGLDATVLKIAHEIRDDFKNVSEINLKKHWNVLLCRLILVSILSVYFMKYPLLIKTNYKLDVIAVSYTVAYKNILIFLANILVLHLSQSVAYHSNLNLIILSFSLISLVYAPRFDLYLIIFIIMIVPRTIIEKMWNEKTRNDKTLKSAQNFIQVITGVIIPTMFGWACNRYGVDAFKVINILPIAIAIFIAHEKMFSNSIKEKKID